MAQQVSPKMKMTILVVLSLLSTIYMVLLRWTRVVTGNKYITTTTVAMQEVIKLVLALIVLVWQNRSITKSIVMIKVEAIDKPRETLKMAVPSFVYALQNNMTYIALSNLDVPIQQILYQLKIPATAFCSVLLLGRSLSYQQWVAVFMVFAGLAMVEYNPSAAHGVATTGATIEEAASQNVFIGVGAVFVAVFCSAFAGVYFEKMVKGSDTSLWIKNLQMYTWTSLASFFAVFSTDYANVAEHGFFFAYTPMVWLLLAVGGVNGLVVSLVLKYADNIVKGFTAAASIILSTIASYFLFQYSIGLSFAIGGFIVCSAICLYGIPVPCINAKYTTVVPRPTTTKDISGKGYDKLLSVVTHSQDDDEVNTKK